MEDLFQEEILTITFNLATILIQISRTILNKVLLLEQEGYRFTTVHVAAPQVRGMEIVVTVVIVIAVLAS